MLATRRTLSFLVLLVILSAPLAIYSQTALQFVAMAPCRVVDTRWDNGPLGGPTMTPKSQRDFLLPQSATCNIPTAPAAYSLNVTVVPHPTLGYLTIWPTGQQKPTISTLNSPDGRVKANAAIVPAGNNGAVSVYVTDATDAILDIDGYFVPATQSTLAFFPLTPCRVADTRWPTGELGGPMLQGKGERDFPVRASSCNIPNTALGYSMNFTVVPRPTLGYLSVWPTGQPRPVVSTLNAVSGVVTANAAIVPAGVQGAIATYVTDNTDLIIDIDGYFASPLSNPDPLSLYTLPPCRVVDSRHGGGGTFSGMLPVVVLASPCGVPSAEAYVLNATVIPYGGHPLGYLTLWPDAEGQPLVSTLNAVDGAITSNMAIVPTLNGAIDAYATNPTDLVLDIFSYFAPIGQLSITTTALPSGTVNYNYTTTVGATGGVLPYTWSIPSGSLPAGLNLDPNGGIISGTPTIAGSYPFTLQVTDSQTPAATASLPLSITINSALTQLSVVTTTLPSGTQNNTYSAMLAATGGVTPYTWSITSGSLPTGLRLNSSTGAITGAPSGGGTSYFTVQVADAEQPPANATAQLSIFIAPAVPLSITTTSLPNGTAGVGYSAPVIAIGGVYPYTWSVIAGNLPRGFSLNSSSGVISGMPTVVGVSNFTVQVTDSEVQAVSATAQLSITVNPGVVHITTTSLPDGIAGQAYSTTLTATGGVTPYTWSLIAGKIPDGLSLSSSGTIGGTPQNVGVSNLTFQVTDSETPQVSATAQLSITIRPPGGGGNPGLLSGNYAFYLNGFNSSGMWTLAGSFISDGNGNITSGVVDGNSVAGQPFNAVVSGLYTISTTGLNLVTMQGPSYGPVTLAFVLTASGNGRIIEYDDTTGQGSRGSGVLRKANPSAFSLNALHGGWVYGWTGEDHEGEREVNVGEFTLTAGNMTNGSCDGNGGGSFYTCTFTGSLSAVDARTGRATVAAQTNNGPSNSVIYVVSANEAAMEGIDSVPLTGNGLFAGSMLQQSGTFNKGSLSGLSVYYAQDINSNTDESQAGIISFDGNGNWNITAGDDDLGGTITQGQPGQGTYTVQSNGAITLSQTGHHGLDGFLVSQNRIMTVDSGSKATLGTFEPQTGGPFSNASLAGTYVGGSLAPLDYVNAENEVMLGPANGAGTLTLNGDSSRPDGLDQWFGTIVNYSIASNGRGHRGGYRRQGTSGGVRDLTDKVRRHDAEDGCGNGGVRALSISD